MKADSRDAGGRATFGRVLAKRVRDREISREVARKVLADFARSTAEGTSVKRTRFLAGRAFRRELRKPN